MLDKKLLESTLKHIIEGFPNILKTSFVDLDAMLTNVDYGDVITVSGRRGIGKTAFMISIIHNLIKQNKKACLFPIEAGAEIIIRRLIAYMLGINPFKLNFIKENEYGKINTILNELAELDLTIIENIKDITAIEDDIKKNKPEFVFIDSIQSLYGFNQNNIFYELKRIARENHCIIINTCNLPEFIEKQENKQPLLSNLRECDRADIYSDVVLFVYRNIDYKVEENNNLAQIIVAKNQNGCCGIINLSFDNSRFYDIKQDFNF